MSERPVTTDALETLGMLHTKKEKRDAIHLAVIQVTATEYMEPGDSISAIEGNCFRDPEGLGIVDPFLSSKKIEIGQQFWMVLKPRLISSLRHVWEHPAFENE